MAQDAKKPPPSWSRPIHYVEKSACGGARSYDRFTHNAAEVSCRFCAQRLKEQAQEKRRPS